MGIFQKIAEGLKKTRDSFFGGLQRIFNSFTKIDEDLFEELEEQMIMSDIGVETSEEICDRLRKKVKETGITDPKKIMELIYEVISEIMGEDKGLDLSVSPAVIMVIGVNGAGKTTTIGKLCHQFKAEGKKVLVAAADTFRAAAIEQLEVWTQRSGVDIVKHAEGSDPGAVVYDALEASKARGCDVVIIDTAGRLHNKKYLMDELAKINRIIDNKAGDCSRETLLVLDATTGQNAVNQAKLFSEVAPVTGIVLTKLDGTAKGGIVISIKNELGIPVKLIGVGEKIDDLQPFDSRMFVDALFSRDYVEEDSDGETVTEEQDEVSETEQQEEETVAQENPDKKKRGFFGGLFAKADETEESTENLTEENAVEEETVTEERDEVSETEQQEEETVAQESSDKKKRGFFGGLFAKTDETEESTEDLTEENAVEGETVAEEQDEVSETETEQEQLDASVIEEMERASEDRKRRFFRNFSIQDSDEVPEKEVTEEETEVDEVKEEPEKKKGFFSRIFGRKDNSDDK